jgi:predicted lipoprotein with Yx(FWY)xxD motif
MAGMSGMGSGELELYAVQTGALGVVVTDGEGRVLYGSDGDQTTPPQSHCTDACAQAWLPLTVPAGQEPQLLGVDAEVVGRLARQDGSSQVTLGGWPVYVNRNDDGQLKAAPSGVQSAGWFAMSPTGAKVALPG